MNAHHLFMKNADVAALAQITPEQKETLTSVPQVVSQSWLCPCWPR